MLEITSGDLKPRLTAGSDIAFIDVREAGQYGEGHPFFAINIPYSQLELRVERLVPRKNVSVVLMDEGNGSGIAEMAARRLGTLGYSDVKLMSGGARAWAHEGYVLYQGVNLPSKAFGELVEHAAGTPHVTAEELHAMQERGDPLVLLDGRTPAEYRRMTIPGSRNVPNGELGHRLPVLLPDNKTMVVINCAGRTRSIIGAQSLRDLGFENPVLALKNGTQGWDLAGFELDRGHEPQVMTEVDGDAAAASSRNADMLICKFALPVIQGETLEKWRADTDRTLYVFDVRTIEEYEAGHLPGAFHAPGGQLVQSTDLWVAVRGARIVLCDDTGLRAAQAASWLRRMGHDAYVLREDVTAQTGLLRGRTGDAEITATLENCAVADVSGRLAAGAILLDLRASVEFRKGHIAGARWAIRPRLGALGLRVEDDIILAGGRNTAELAVMDLRDFNCAKLSFLEGVAEDWKAAGLDIAETPAEPADAACIDYLFFVHDRHAGNLDAARGYLEWELALVEQMDEQERGIFALDF